MLHSYREATAESLHDAIAWDLTFNQPDSASSTDVTNHVVVGLAESFAYEYDLAALWHSERRWNQLVREYVDAEALELFLNAVEAKLSVSRKGVAVLRTRSQSAKRNEGASWRAWGSCMLAWSFRRQPVPMVTLYSRTSYLGFLGPLDVACSAVIARRIGERVGINPADMAFAWHLGAAQLHGFKSLPWYLRQEGPSDAPGAKLLDRTLTGLDRFDLAGVQYGDMTYGQLRRARKRWHVENVGLSPAVAQERYGNGSHSVASQNNAFPKLPPMMASWLTFDCLKGWPSTGEARTMVESPEENA